MIKKFNAWFAVFGLSFLVSDVLCWTTQGKAFLYLQIFISIVLLIFSIKKVDDSFFTFLFALFLLAIVIAFDLFATWGATKIFEVDFYITYEIMTFGQCLCGNNKKDED